MAGTGGSTQIGNSDEYGVRKNNYPWQLRVLQLLAEISNAVGGAAVSKVPSVVVATMSGATTAGKTSVSLLFRGTGGTLDGVAVPDNSIFDFSAVAPGDTVASITYTVPTGGEQRIIITYLT